MKAGWQSKTLGDVCEFQRGLTYAKSDEVDVSDNVVLRATNIDLKTNLLDFAELKYINDKVAVPDSKKVKVGSLMICTASGSKSHLGKVAYIGNDYGYAFGGFMGMVTPKKELHPKYLFHRMTSNAYKDFIAALSDGANINNLKFDDLKQFVVPFPPLPEQQRIVGILDDAFDGIATAKANAEQNLQNARALFESHLQSVFTNGGEGWEEKRLGDVADLVDCLHKTPTYAEIGFPMVRVTDVKSGSLDLSKTRKVNEKTFIEFSKKRTPKIGDIVFSRVGSCVVSAIVNSNDPFCLGQNTVFILPKINSMLLYHFLNSPIAKVQFEKFIEGTTQPTISLKSIREISVPVAPLSEHESVVAKLDTLREETQRLESLYQRKLAALDELKKSLLHQAFSGML